MADTNKTNARIAELRSKKMTVAKIRLAQVSLSRQGTSVDDLCRRIGVSSITLYQYVNALGGLTPLGVETLSKLGARSVWKDALISDAPMCGDGVSFTSAAHPISPVKLTKDE
jgi:hypothetical protein